MTNSDGYRPIQNLGGAPTENGWLFHRPDQDLEIPGFQREIEEILALSNGINDTKHILGYLAAKEFDVELCDTIITELDEARVLADSREQQIEFHNKSNNPSPYFWELSPAQIADITDNDTFLPREGVILDIDTHPTAINELVRRRESCRSFEEAPVPIDLIASSMSDAYSKELRPSPSAGGLYPIRLYLIKRRDSDSPGGVYQYDHNRNRMLAYDDEVDVEAFKYALNSETFLFNANAVIVIAADLKRHSKKYANRGYRYSLIEAGHVAQNIHLALTGYGISTIEYGGFSDAELQKELKLDGDEAPLITIGLGYPSDKACVTGLEIADKLSPLVGENMPVEWVSVDFDSETAKQAKFYTAFAKFKRPNSAYDSEEHQFSSGTATSIQMAYVKAVAEAYERYMGGDIHVDKTSPAEDLELPWLDPRLVRPLTKEQIELSSKVEEFTEKKNIDWVKAKQYPSGGDYYVPIDLVYYPLNESLIDRGLVAEADSSGMAAHIDKATAISRATLELIERDAIMRNWFEKCGGPRIAHEALGTTWTRRIEKIEQQGKRLVDVIDLSNDGVVILNVIIRSTDGSYPFFVNGSSASNTDFTEALSKALDEAELGLLEASNQAECGVITPESVHSPADHGKLYLHNTYESSISWLWSGGMKNDLSIADKCDVIGKFKPYVIEYTNEDSPLHVVRAICPQLVPINFGVGNEHYTHLSVKESCRVQPGIPHYFA